MLTSRAVRSSTPCRDVVAVALGQYGEAMRVRQAVDQRTAVASALVAVLGVALTAGPAAAAAPTVLGRVTGTLPRSSRAVTEIRAFEAGSARLVATATASPTGVFRLALPPGGYVLATNVTPKRGPSSAACSG